MKNLFKNIMSTTDGGLLILNPFAPSISASFIFFFLLPFSPLLQPSHPFRVLSSSIAVVLIRRQLFFFFFGFLRPVRFIVLFFGFLRPVRFILVFVFVQETNSRWWWRRLNSCQVVRWWWSVLCEVCVYKLNANLLCIVSSIKWSFYFFLSTTVKVLWQLRPSTSINLTTVRWWKSTSNKCDWTIGKGSQQTIEKGADEPSEKVPTNHRKKCRWWMLGGVLLVFGVKSTLTFKTDGNTLEIARVLGLPLETAHSPQRLCDKTEHRSTSWEISCCYMWCPFPAHCGTHDKRTRGKTRWSTSSLFWCEGCMTCSSATASG